LRLKYADSVIHLDFNRPICMRSIPSRAIFGYGRTRVDMADDCPECIDFEFIRYTWNYHASQRPSVLKALRSAEERNGVIIVSLRDRRSVNGFLTTIK
jgi:hypothetical protein